MGLKNIHQKLKIFRLRRFLIGDGGSEKREPDIVKKPSWMMPISHGYHVVEDRSFRGGSYESDSDSIVVQREQIEELELWFFGVYDARIGDGVAKYMQSHFFDRKPKESHIRRKSKETMRKAYIGARAKIRHTQKADESTWTVGSASVMVINGDKLVMANMGDYRAVVCRDGVAHQLSSKNQETPKRHWFTRFISGTRTSKGSELVIGAESINSDTEFIILASTGIWEVMKSQEAVNLIRHKEDPQEAAEYLAKEALTRMSKSSISCLVIRFD